jgi:hypothetical protein
MGGGSDGSPSTISAASRAMCGAGLGLGIGGCGDMVWGGGSVISGSTGSVELMPVWSVSGSFGLGVANIEAAPRCNINIQFTHTHKDIEKLVLLHP